MQLLTRKFTVNQYHQMAKAGIIDHQENVELIQGEIITMSPIGFRHAFVTTYLANCFSRQLGEKTIVSSQNPIQLGDHSQPQPDIALLKPIDNFYADRLPTAADILLLIEVADSSLIYDQTVKIPLYAQHNIHEFWLVNLNQRQLERCTNPLNNTYQNKTIFHADQSISPLFFSELTINLKTIFS